MTHDLGDIRPDILQSIIYLWTRDGKMDPEGRNIGVDAGDGRTDWWTTEEYVWDHLAKIALRGPKFSDIPRAEMAARLTKKIFSGDVKGVDRDMDGNPPR